MARRRAMKMTDMKEWKEKERGVKKMPVKVATAIIE